MNHLAHLVFWCLLSECYLGRLTVKSPLNPITTQTMANCTILSHASELLFSTSLMVLIMDRNFRALTVKFSHNPIRPKRWLIRNIPRDTSKSSILATLTVLIIKATFWRSYKEVLNEPHYDPKDGQFERFWEPPLKTLSHASESSLSGSLMVLIIRASFWIYHSEIITSLPLRPKI